MSNKLDGGNYMNNRKKLYEDIKSYFRRLIDTDDLEISFLVLYVVGTHYFNNYQSYPMLHISGDYATGKNRRLDIMILFCYEPLILTDPSLSSLFRIINDTGGTVLIDEADEVFKKNDFQSALLAGYKKGGQISRSERTEFDFVAALYNVYCPKVLVTRQGLPTDALKSRSITVITSPKSRTSDVPDILSESDVNDGLILKEKLDLLVKKYPILESNDIGLKLTSRSAEIFNCLEDVAYMFGELAVSDLHAFVKEKYLPETRYNTMMTLNEDIIRILCVFWDKPTNIYLGNIKAALQQSSGDYRNTHEKEIAGCLRGLNFELKRDSKGYYVIKDSKILEILLERYQILPADAESSDFNSDNSINKNINHDEYQTDVADVGNEGRYDKRRPKRSFSRGTFENIRRKLFKSS